jgi:hypothetical protein
MSFSLLVFFEDPFWVGLFSRSEGDGAQYCRVVFGGEPSDTEIYHYFLDHWRDLEFSSTLPVLPAEPQIKNPKRRQRAVSRQLHEQNGQKRSYSIIKQALQTQLPEQPRMSRKELENQHREHVLEVRRAVHKAKQRGH